MNPGLITVIVSLAVNFATPAYPRASNELSFKDIEAQQPWDPLLSFTQRGIEMHTPKSDLAGATIALGNAIPDRMPQSAAEAILRKAGAHCRAPETMTENCYYHDIQTHSSYIDSVEWQIHLKLADGQVVKVSVDRTWVRRQSES